MPSQCTGSVRVTGMTPCSVYKTFHHCKLNEGHTGVHQCKCSFPFDD